MIMLFLQFLLFDLFRSIMLSFYYIVELYIDIGMYSTLYLNIIQFLYNVIEFKIKQIIYM